MKHGILKRAIALCMVGIMAFSLTACGDSENEDEGEEIVQDSTQESEEGTIEAAESGEAADTVNSSENIVSVAHVSSSGSNGNGTTAPIFKPGEESQPGEGPEPGAGTGTQPGVGTQQSQQPQQPQSGTQSQQPSTGNQPAHTHSWVTNTIHHEATGHYENRVTGTEQVQVGLTPAKTEYICDCGYRSDSLGGWESHSSDELWKAAMEWEATGKPTSGLHQRFETVQSGGDPIYETRNITQDVWVVDSAAWDETVTTCSTCGAKQ